MIKALGSGLYHMATTLLVLPFYSLIYDQIYNTDWPDTSRRQRRRLPYGHCFGAHEMLQYKLTISSCSVPLTIMKMPRCPCPYKNKAYRPVPSFIKRCLNNTKCTFLSWDYGFQPVQCSMFTITIQTFRFFNQWHYANLK